MTPAPFKLSAQELYARLSSAETTEDVHRAYQQALAAYDQTAAATESRFACCAGCSLCCSLRVEVYAHEVFLIAQYVRSHFGAAELADLMRRLEAHSEKVLPLTPAEHATRNVACPLLVDGCCSVYSVRPMNCRRHHSLDLRACQYTFEHPTDLQAPSAHDRPLYQALTAEMKEAASVYAALRLDTNIYELGTALHEALTDEESWAGWVNHMEAFAKASMTPAGDPTQS